MSSRQLKNLLSRGVPHTCPRPLHPTLIPRNLFIPLLLNFNCTSTYSTSKSNSSLYTSTSVTSPRFSPSPIFVPPHQNSSNPIDTPTNTRNFSTTTRSAMATATPFFSNEPDGPKLMTAFPGPKSQDAIKKLDAVFDTRSLNMICDYGQSRGNYIADCDGNVSASDCALRSRRSFLFQLRLCCVTPRCDLGAACWIAYAQRAPVPTPGPPPALSLSGSFYIQRPQYPSAPLYTHNYPKRSFIAASYPPSIYQDSC